MLSGNLLIDGGSLTGGMITNSGSIFLQNGSALNMGIDNSGIIVTGNAPHDTGGNSISPPSCCPGPLILNRASGTISVTGPGDRLFGYFLQNQGTINIAAGASFGGSVSSSGTINLSGIFSTTQHGFGNSGVINVRASGVLDVNGVGGSGIAGNSGTINLAGLLKFDQCPSFDYELPCTGFLGSGNGSGTINLEGGSINGIGDFGEIDVENAVTGHGTLQGVALLSGGSLTPVGTITGGAGNLGGVVTIGSGDRLDGGVYQTRGTTTVQKGGILSGGYFETGGAADVQAGGLVTGPFDIAGGKVQLDGVVGPNGVTVGSGGSLTGTGTILGDLVMAGLYSSENMTVFGDAMLNGIFDESIFGLDNFGQLLVSGNASLDGTLNIDLSKGYIPSIGSKFFIIDSSSVSGVFANITGETINGREEFEVLYNPNSVELCVVSTSNPVCGATPPSVPEPRSIVLLGTVAVGVLWRVKRRRSASAQFWRSRIGPNSKVLN